MFSPSLPPLAPMTLPGFEPRLGTRGTLGGAYSRTGGD